MDLFRVFQHPLVPSEVIPNSQFDGRAGREEEIRMVAVESTRLCVRDENLMKGGQGGHI